MGDNTNSAKEIEKLHKFLNRLISEGFIAADLITEKKYGPETVEAVKALQKKLNKLGMTDYEGNPLKEDGYFGQRVKSAYEKHVLKAKPLSLIKTEFGFKCFPVENATSLINNYGQPREGYTTKGGHLVPKHTHKGIDISAPLGSKVFAVMDGTVEKAKTYGGGPGGRYVVIKHDDGSVTKYMHLDKITVNEGQKVKAGEQIGTVGNTGLKKGNESIHLHFEYLKSKKKWLIRVNPFKMLELVYKDNKELREKKVAQRLVEFAAGY